ncbi:MAG: hypothetical protein ABSG85_04680 [Spirochaetia bacterium]|jgi:hypothetical protein
MPRQHPYSSSIVYIKDVGEYVSLFTQYSEKLAAERANMVKIGQEKGKKEARKRDNDVVFRS